MPSWISGARTRIGRMLAVLAFLPFLFGPSAAHVGHDHGSPETETTGQPIAPRIAASSEQYELVGILHDSRLSIYVDQFDTNTPVTDVDVAVFIGDATKPTAAKLAEDGVYMVESEAFEGHGSVNLAFSLTGGEGDDLLAGTLDLPDALALAETPAAEIGPLHRWAHERFGDNDLIALLLASGAAGAFVILLFRPKRRARRISTVIALAMMPAFIGSAEGQEDGHTDEQHDHAHEDISHGAGDETDHAGHRHAPVPVYEAPRRNPDGSVFLPKPTQRLLEVRTELAQREKAQSSISLIGQVIADPNGVGLVQSITGGRIIAPDEGLPHIGQRVEKGEVLATIERPMPPEERVLISEKVGEIDQLIAVAETKLERTRQLLEKRVAPEAQVRDAEIELEGLRERRRIVMETRAEPEVLVAPLDGVISKANVVPGQVVAPQDVLFEVVDPKRLWIEAQVYGGTDPSALDHATARTRDGTALKLVRKGFSRALREQATVVQFEIQNPPPKLAIGQPLRVIAATGEPRQAMILPRAAVVRGDNGAQIVWRHDAPERFTPVPVRAEPFDAARVAVAEGVEEGARIVTQGANLVAQIR